MKGSFHAHVVSRRVPKESDRAREVGLDGREDRPRDVGTQTTIYNWLKHDRIDRGEIPGVSTQESKELTRARRRIRELEAEVEILRRAHELLGTDVVRPKGSTR